MDTDLAKTRVDTMLRSGHADPATLAATVVAKISVAQVDAVLAQLGVVLGTYQRLEGTQGTYIAHFAKGTNDVLVSLDTEGKISGLLFKPPRIAAGSLEIALERLRASAGTLSYALTEDGSERAAFDPAAPLAIGSAFKLAVLAALRDEIAVGRRLWSDVVALDKRLKVYRRASYTPGPTARRSRSRVTLPK